MNCFVLGVKNNDFILMPELSCHDDHIERSMLKSFWMHFGCTLEASWEDFWRIL